MGYPPLGKNQLDAEQLGEASDAARIVGSLVIDAVGNHESTARIVQPFYELDAVLDALASHHPRRL